MAPAQQLRRLLGRRTFSTVSRLDARYGFIGLGKMGYPMARNLRSKLPADDTFIVYDVNADSTREFRDELKAFNVNVADNVKSVVEESDTIITMLPEPQHVSGLFKELTSNPPKSSSAGKLFIDSSTIDIETSLSVNKLVSECAPLAATFVDAPVSGGVVGASAGTLAFLVGCSSSELDRVSKILSLMGSRILHCGDAGAGLAAKLANNYLLAISNIGVAEAMNLGLKLGLDKQVLKNVINVSSGRCWSSEVNNPIDNEVKGFAGGFGAALMLKDLELARTAARQAGVKLELDGKASEVYKQALAKEGNKDFSVVFKVLQEQNKN